MQEVYNIDISAPACDIAHICCCAAQLGPTSRVARTLSPANQWNEEDYLLAYIADNVAALAWGLSGGDDKDKPKPVPRPVKTAHEKHVSMKKEKLDKLLFGPRGKKKQPST